MDVSIINIVSTQNYSLETIFPSLTMNRVSAEFSPESDL